MPAASDNAAVTADSSAGPPVEPMSDIRRQRPRKWARPTTGE
jgi:hypothetical protein